MNLLLLTVGSSLTIATMNYYYDKIFPSNKNIEIVFDTIADEIIDNEVNTLIDTNFPKINDETEKYIDNIINPNINTIINETIEYLHPEHNNLDNQLFINDNLYNSVDKLNENKLNENKLNKNKLNEKYFKSV